jgi:HlyD family secretion protein
MAQARRRECQMHSIGWEMAEKTNADQANQPTIMDPTPAPPVAGELVPVHEVGGLPVSPPTRLTVSKKLPKKRWWLRIAVLLAILSSAAGGGYYWWQHLRSQMLPGIASGNGRLEADLINIDTKYPGRIAEILADEGDIVKAGQVVARMDTRDIEASLKKAQSQVRQATRAIDEARANVTQQQTQVVLAQQEYDRAVYLVQKGFQTKEVMDQRQQQLDGARAALNANNVRVVELQHALDAATHDAEYYSVEINDNTLVAPVAGRLQYRVANVGEVLPAGGHVFAMLDTSYVYMDIYLPTQEAGKVKYGTPSRIVVDAYPKAAIPAKVMFIATQAQFTPKTVETENEREKLMFRVRVRIDADWLRGRTDAVSSGLPGMAYVLTDAAAHWPDWLQLAVAQ